NPTRPEGGGETGRIAVQPLEKPTQVKGEKKIPPPDQSGRKKNKNAMGCFVCLVGEKTFFATMNILTVEPPFYLSSDIDEVDPINCVIH
ncbi:hypothetical protein PENTCL1PPCAC_18063, partial [Pristionchus entomophagus]